MFDSGGPAAISIAHTRDIYSIRSDKHFVLLRCQPRSKSFMQGVEHLGKVFGPAHVVPGQLAHRF